MMHGLSADLYTDVIKGIVNLSWIDSIKYEIII